MTHTTRIGRRGFLTAASAATLAATGLSACGTGSGSGTNGAGSSGSPKAVLPTYKKLTPAMAADSPGSDLVPDLYYKYPDPPYKAVNHEVGSGGDLTSMVMTYNPPPTPLGQNSYWQLMNQKLNVNYKPDLVASADYVQKFSTVIAGGGTLPDIIQVPTWLTLPRLPQLIDNSFTDLAKYVGGDAVLKYPNLANLPTYAWQNALSKGRLWGVPITRPVFPNTLMYRLDISEAAGFAQAPKTQDDFMAWAKSMTDAKNGRWALLHPGGSLGYAFGNTVSGMFEVPNGWKLDGDNLVDPLELDGWWQGLDYIKKLWDAGVVHPDSPSISVTQGQTLFFNGTIAAVEDGLAFFSNASKYPNAKFDGRAPWTADGSKVWALQGSGVFSVNAIRKTDDEKKVDELLRIMDYLSAPYGSEEYTSTTFGVKGTHYNLVDGSPVPIPEKAADLALSMSYIGTPPPTLYGPTEVLKTTYQRVQKLEKDLGTGLVKNPAQGLTSETGIKNGKYTQAILEARNDYVMGRKSLSDVQAAADDYKKNLMPTIKKELLEQMKERGDI